MSAPPPPPIPEDPPPEESPLLFPVDRASSYLAFLAAGALRTIGQPVSLFKFAGRLHLPATTPGVILPDEPLDQFWRRVADANGPLVASALGITALDLAWYQDFHTNNNFTTKFSSLDFRNNLLPDTQIQNAFAYLTDSYPDYLSAGGVKVDFRDGGNETLEPPDTIGIYYALSQDNAAALYRLGTGYAELNVQQNVASYRTCHLGEAAIGDLLYSLWEIYEALDGWEIRADGSNAHPSTTIIQSAVNGLRNHGVTVLIN